MSISFDAVAGFWDYLKEEEGVSKINQGLVDDAPQSAIDAYEGYLKMQAEAVKEGIEL